jgi:hypothetical protein
MTQSFMLAACRVSKAARRSEIDRPARNEGVLKTVSPDPLPVDDFAPWFRRTTTWAIPFSLT